jgi:hypothetical protein
MHQRVQWNALNALGLTANASGVQFILLVRPCLAEGEIFGEL